MKLGTSVNFVYLRLNTPHAKFYLSLFRRIRYILSIFLYFRLKLDKNVKITTALYILWRYFEKDTMNKWPSIYVNIQVARPDDKQSAAPATLKVR